MLPLFAATIFLSAALLFLVQPMIARMVLPLLGGSPAVWNTSMVFFQAVLLAGYLYAHLLTSRVAPRRQLVIHSAVLALPLLAALGTSSLPVLDPRDLDPPGAAQPTAWLLLALTLAVGAPFFVLSTTGPLVQRWFSCTGHRHARDPYFLYAASNLGSMLALAAYPLILERALTLDHQRVWFSAGYIAFAVLAIACGALMLRARPTLPAPARPEVATPRPTAHAPTPWPTRLRWIALAAVPSSLMLAVTQHVSSDIASVPLLWTIPLATYLLTMIIAFGRYAAPLPALSLAFRVAAAVLTLAIVARLASPVWAVIPLHLLGLFLGALVCHARLARERPDPARLTEYFLLIALGGVFGGSFNALIAPRIFSGIAEYPIALVAACLLSVPGSADRPDPAALPRLAAAREVGLFLGAAALWTALAAWAVTGGVPPGPSLSRFGLVMLLLLGAYVVWRARVAPAAPDVLAPVAVLAASAGLQLAFARAEPVGGWPAAGGAACAIALLLFRLLKPGSPAASLAGDLLVPAMVGLFYAAAHHALRQVASPAPAPAWLEPARDLILFAVPAALLLMSHARRWRAGLAVAVLLAMSYFNAGAPDTSLLTSRTFFGVHRVSTDPSGAWRLLTHGTTRHGLQATDPALAGRPTTYYHPSGPIATIFRERMNDPSFDKVAIIGLGAGGLAPYGRPHQAWTYYEIDPEVVRIARDSGLFTYLKNSAASITTVVGDGRLRLAEAPAASYDLIIVDAFSSDAIPIHLCTREAVAMYLEKLTGDGVIAFHISNRYLDLRPVLAAIAGSLQAPAIVRTDAAVSAEERADGKVPTIWVALAKRPERLAGLLVRDGWTPLPPPPTPSAAPLWTDDDSNILPVLRWR